ncbi:MAG TPA: molecular chaperone DnaJ [Gemmatimonadales bacterium]
MAGDYYDVLGVSRDAVEGDIKKAYRRLAMEYHPDRNNGDKAAEEKFKEITEAYDVLRDPQKRAQFDRYGKAGVAGGPAGFDFHHFDISEALSVFMRDFGGLGGFEAVFGGGERSRRTRRRGQDIEASIRISLEEVVTGARRAVKLRALERCARCKGSGSKGGKPPAPCRTCGGVGEVHRRAESFFGQLVSVAPCPTCGGEGTTIADPCPDCRGDGRVRAERTVDVEVPPGVSGNNYLTVRGAGAAGPRGGPAGDLVVRIEVTDDPVLERRGDDLIYDLALSFSQAALGADVTVPIPGGTVPVPVPPGTQSGTVLTVRGKGLPVLGRQSRGDLHVRVQVWTPERLTGEQADLFRRLSELEGDPPQGESLGRRFWNRMREALGA